MEPSSSAKALGSVADRLVGGMMFHSEHADLCWHMGFERLARENEDGYSHDSKCLRKVRRLGIRHLGILLPEGEQRRSGLLGQFSGERCWDVGTNRRRQALERVLTDMVAWEEGTCEVLRDAHECVLTCGDMSIANAVGRMLADTEAELSEYRNELARSRSSNWDLGLAMFER